MKKYLLMLIAATMICSAYAEEGKFVPAGSVSSYTQTEYAVTTKFGEYYRSTAAKYVHLYDVRTGLETELSEYTAKDALLNRITYSYDDSLNLVGSAYYNETNALVWRTEIKYDANGRKIDETEFDKNDNRTGRTIYKYNGNTAEEAFYNAAGKLLAKVITKYNNSNKIEEICEYNDDGSLDSKKVYGYTDGVLTQIEEFNSTGAFTGKKSWRYDSKGRITEEQIFNASNIIIQRNVHKNDDKGNPVKITCYLVAEKFGGVVNEMMSISEYSYKY